MADNKQSAPPAPENKALVSKQFQEETLNKVEDQIKVFQQTGALILPPNYIASNALRAAWVVLLETEDKDGHPVLEVCTKTSICNALLKMVVYGLNPVKKQCDFIAYGNKLVCTPEYTGNILLAKRYGDLKEINAQVVYKGETFITAVDPKTGRKQLIKHETDNAKLGLGAEITYAYTVATFNDGTTACEVMSMSEIDQSWKQSKAYGKSLFHKNFPGEACRRTLYNRHTKLMIRTSDDAPLLVKKAAEEDLGYADIIEENAQETRKLNSGQRTMGFDTEPETDGGTGSKPLTPTNEVKTGDKPNVDPYVDPSTGELFPKEKPGF